MKKFGICLVLAFFVLGTSCFAQSNNDAQRIVGTWKNIGTNTTFIFNSDGTYTSSGEKSKGNGNYLLNGSNLYLRNGNDRSAYPYMFFFSPNGRVFVVHLDRDQEGFWFEKQ